MRTLKKTCIAAAIATSIAGIATAANAQYIGVDVGGVGVGVGPGYGYYDRGYGPYDEDAVVVTRAPAPSYYGYWSPSRESACVQDHRDFPERRGFRCR
jgi:hypothetical protein